MGDDGKGLSLVRGRVGTKVVGMKIEALGDTAWRVTVAEEVGEVTLGRVRAVVGALREAEVAGVREVVGAFTAVAVHYGPEARGETVRAAVEEVVTAALAGKCEVGEGREVVVPVVYGGEAGPDLGVVVERAGLTEAEVVAAHGAGRYRVHAVGFAPGFPYLAGLAETLHTPRRATPRVRVAAGSVAIGGGQTGIYPVAGPGGWQVIGRTGLRLFDPERRPPALLQVGDGVRFEAAVEGAEVEAVAEVGEATEGDFLVERSGVLTTVQDGGRWGWQDQGVTVGGAVDGRALAVANILVGNAAGAAGIEWTLQGPRLVFRREVEIALAGAVVEGIENGRVRVMRAGEVLDLGGRVLHGCRGYVAVRGGIDVAEVLGGRGVDLRGGFGGGVGRALREGDGVGIFNDQCPMTNGGGWGTRLGSVVEGEVVLRVMRGPEVGEFGEAGWAGFLAGKFLVSARSDRMGVRLEGEVVAGVREGARVSAPVATGAVQVPADGRPIVLLGDRQTIGGYAQIAYVIAADWGKLAQVAPGQAVGFREVSAAEAEAARWVAERELAWLRLGVAAARKGGRVR